MSLTSCKSCNAQISSNARECPKCHEPAGKRKFVPCKTCKEPLDLEKQYKRYALINNSASGSSSPIMLACPHCGDPQPISSSDHLISGPMTSNKLAWLVIIGFVVFAFLILSNVK